ncbi:uncharacterized protein MYCFIDRAFT_174681 [Pseudocercospora fijiensis CIRAD86]|uniref:Uncharacterized protein n=1 Tax=Pseudocercospora fijiensis (strain CIRAD86) TaxID=383855 RepID=M3AF27_PSEFD|nr:uncharacterized protein MYCFIDRAFT_174681 [Pseudocercospora fijiensis CIRAD86]EME83206.1 hypothetical protein MYCFIDRAFT_174681 [Pseudocercospora fijiensis CIRAD86]
MQGRLDIRIRGSSAPLRPARRISTHVHHRFLKSSILVLTSLHTLLEIFQGLIYILKDKDMISTYIPPSHAYHSHSNILPSYDQVRGLRVYIHTSIFIDEKFPHPKLGGSSAVIKSEDFNYTRMQKHDRWKNPRSESSQCDLGLTWESSQGSLSRISAVVRRSFIAFQAFQSDICVYIGSSYGRISMHSALSTFTGFATRGTEHNMRGSGTTK